MPMSKVKKREYMRELRAKRKNAVIPNVIPKPVIERDGRLDVIANLPDFGR